VVIATMKCHICQSSGLQVLPEPGRSPRLVSSDVQAVDGHVQWAVCQRCQTIQKILDDDWCRMTDRIYSRYDINHQAGGDEPRVFNTEFGSGARSTILLKLVLSRIEIPEGGRLLDVGCSNGNLLKTFHIERPRWGLFGSEVTDGWKKTVLALPGVEDFYVGRQPSFPLTYDIISLSHVVEHLPNPIDFLKHLCGSLAPDGFIVIATPNIRQNPIDLLIADHCSHFDENSMAQMLTAGGFEIVHLTASSIPKELVSIVRVATKAQLHPPRQFRDAPMDLCRYYFKLMEGVGNEARSARAEASVFGIMGSSVAAAWVWQELDGQVDFFIDEDVSRHGGHLMGRPILGLDQVPAGARVFIPMSAPVAEGIISRARGLPIQFCYLDWNRIEGR
jgi:SAM-dependent methyltransferase